MTYRAFLFQTILAVLFASPLFGQGPGPAADASDSWLPALEGKRIAVVANVTSRAGDQHLIDFLVNHDVEVVRIFTPEHGFRGNYAAGEKISDGRDSRTGLPLHSLYGNNKKPGTEDLAGIDLVVFDIQDVGARFYTYISTMSYVMEACAENSIPLMILDRPNPNGDFIDGPILQPELSSFVGLHPVPIVHGMTVGEYASMVNGEGWLKDSIQCDLTVIPCTNYSHSDRYVLPVPPSPNLPNQASVLLYPSLCLFEGTPVSIGRGTDKPFQIIGAPWFTELGDTFTPKPVSAAPHPKFENEVCHGVNVRSFGENYLTIHRELYLFWLIEAHKMYNGDAPFFTPFFDKLAGTAELRKQIEAGWTEEQIRASWEPGLNQFMITRAKYLIYPERR